MDSFNALVIQLQIIRGQTPAGTVPLQAAMYLAIAFGRDPAEVFRDTELLNAPELLDHAAFVRTVRRLLPLDEQGTRSDYTGTASREDLRGLLKTFGRDECEVDDYIRRCVPEEKVGYNKFIRILAKPIAGQRYPIGLYTISRPLDSPITKHRPLPPRRQSRTKARLGFGCDPVASAVARQMRQQRLRTGYARRIKAEQAAGMNDELNILTYRLCVMAL